MHWARTWRADPEVAAIADRHYSRKTPGAPQFSPPGAVLVLKTGSAGWVTSFPKAEYVDHAWPGAMVCTLFRNEGNALSSALITEAVAASRWTWHVPELGMVTFVDPKKVRPKRDPGYCFLMAGFRYVGKTKAGQRVLRLFAEDWPAPCAPRNSQTDLFSC